jgi:hypothetical protein
MTLTDTQLVLLSAASRREDGAIVLTPNLKGGAAGKVIGKLLREGLVEEVTAGASMPVWRRSGAQPSELREPPRLETRTGRRHGNANREPPISARPNLGCKSLFGSSAGKSL